MSARDRAIGIVLGLILGIAIVAAFVFGFSGETVDAPALDQGNGAAERPAR